MKKHWKPTLTLIYRPTFLLNGSLTFRLTSALLVLKVFPPVVLTTFGLLLATIVQLVLIRCVLMLLVAVHLGRLCGAWVSLNIETVGFMPVTVVKFLINLVRTCRMCYGLARI